MRKTLLFRSVLGETGVLTDKPMNRVDAYGAPAHGRRRLQGQARLPRKLIGMPTSRRTRVGPVGRASP